MIVLINVQKYCVEVYSENIVTQIPFENLDMLQNLLSGKKVMYITQATEVNGDDIVNLVKQVSKKTDRATIQSNQPESWFLYATIGGSLRFTDKDLKLAFTANERFLSMDKLYGEYGTDVLEKYTKLAKMIKDGKIKIINSTEKRKIQQEYFNEEKARQAKIDESLDSIIVDGKVENYEPSDDMFADDHADAIEIKVTAGPGGSNNEGSLLPTDF